MPVEVAMWRVESGAPIQLISTGAPLESGLEQLIEANPTILGEPLLLIGRQVLTSNGTFVDLLAVDADGSLHVLELKRDRTPREVVAQALDYGSWVTGLSHNEVLEIFAQYRPAVAFEQAFADRFGTSPPEELNTSHVLTVVASEVDAATERIVNYLRGQYSVPINVAFFNYFVDEGREFLARTWLADEAVIPARGRSRGSGGSSREEWDGRYWYASFGDDPLSGRNWDDAIEYGFMSAGGGLWYSRTLRSLPIGALVFVCIPKRGYVAFGTVIGEARSFVEAVVRIDGTDRKLTELDLAGNYRHLADDDENAEWIVPMEWKRTLSREQAIWKVGMFANQNSACKLRNKFTIEILEQAFEVSNDKELL